MKKILALTIAVILCSLSSFVTPALNVKQPKTEANANVAMLSSKSFKKSSSKVLEARFLNMLNHNYSYNDDFESYEKLVNNATIALLNLRDKQNEEFISQDIISKYLFNMYGVDFVDYSEINIDFPQVEGFVYIIPRGFTKYNHKIISVCENQDGSYTVKTKVLISAHDDGEYYDICTTVFEKNKNSDFGFKIICSEIGEKGSNI